MNFNKLMLAVLSSALFCTVAITDAYAGDLLKCERRSTKTGAPKRSKISVQVEDQAPNALYTARVRSGDKTKRAIIAADDFGTAEFDFDSNRNDVLAGAKRIPKDFIDGQVSVKVTDALGVKVAEDTVSCRIR